MSKVDFDLHGLVGIRLRDARTQEVQVVTRQLGPIERPLDRPPDIIIQFVDELELSSSVPSVTSGRMSSSRSSG